MGLLSLTQDPHRLETPSIHAEECGSQRELLGLPHQRRARGEKLVGESVLWEPHSAPHPRTFTFVVFLPLLLRNILRLWWPGSSSCNIPPSPCWPRGRDPGQNSPCLLP